MDKAFIGISGMIGAGKTTLAHSLSKVLQLPVYEEGVIDNEYLVDFYKDMKRHAFPLQVYLLNKRFRQHQQIIWQGQGGVQDRTIYEDSIFAKMLKDSGLMDERDYRCYIELFNNMANFMRKPTLIVHLDVSPEESLKRIKMRGRDMEKSVTLEYLTNLHRAYEEFLRDISRIIPVIKVNWSEFRTPEEMADVIRREWAAISNIKKVCYEEHSGI